MTLLYTGDPRHAEAWRTALAQHAPDLVAHVRPQDADLAGVRYLLSWTFPAELLPRLPRLEAIFSTGAGVEQFDLSRIAPSVQLVRMIDPTLAAGMAEYAVLAVLTLHRDILDYQEARRARRWAPLRIVPAAERRIGVMGLGAQGLAILAALKPFGFPLAGWSRSSRAIDGVATFAGDAALPDFLGRCDILVCVLPLTAQTRGILRRELFRALPPGAGLINIGRGGHLCETDLLDALDEGRLTGAVLDVMCDEPPAPDHPFWDHPRILLTPHIAGMTSPATAARTLADNLRRHAEGQPMMGLVRRERMAEDQRRVLVSITPKSRALARRIVPLIEAQYRALEQRVGAELLAQLYATLDQLLQRLDAPAEPDAT